MICSVCGAPDAIGVGTPEVPLLICEPCFVRLFLP